MHRIISLDKIRSRMSLREDDGITATLESALDAALVRVSTLLNTSFDYGARTDFFFVDVNQSLPRGGLYTLRTREGFLRTDTLVTLTSASSLSEVTVGEYSETPFIVDHERGWVKVPVEGCSPFLRLDYSHGFKEVTATSPQEEAPSWLQEVVLGNVVRFLFSQQVSDGQGVSTEVLAFLEKFGCEVLDKHLRSSSETITPLI